MSELRPIDTAGFTKPKAIDAGSVPMLEWIGVDKLVVDDAYQRPVRKTGRAVIRAIADAFDWSQFSPVIVAPVEGGRFAIIDGQHRTTAAAICGFDKVPCQVVLADRARQAAAFAAINGRVQKITTMQLFHAAREAGEDWAAGVAKVAADAGVTILRYPIGASVPDRPQHSTMAVVVIRKLLERHGAELIGMTLRCITRTQLGDDPGALGQLWITAIATVLSERPPLWPREADVISFFDRIDAGALVKAAYSTRGHGLSVTEALAIRLRAEIDSVFTREAA